MKKRFIWLVPMVLCLIYSVSIYMVASGTFSFLIWIAGALFFGICFYLSGEGRWKRIPGWLRAAACALVALGAVAFLACMALMLGHFGDKGEEDLDYVIVLGAQMREQGPSTIYKFRLDAASSYLMDNPETVCILSGAAGRGDSIAEGEGGKNYLISRGISADRLMAENEARDTRENITNSFDLIRALHPEGTRDLRIGIVTNNFHLYRGIKLARSLTDSSICGISARTLPWYLPNNMVRECFGILKDFIF